MMRRGCLGVRLACPNTATIECPAHSNLHETRRGIKTLDVREYKPLGTPIEFRFYQRYSNAPTHQSGIQFLTHFSTHQRFRVYGGNYIDYMNWGKEQGQARLPHRHQRVAFDFNDSLNPTKAKFNAELFASQDPSLEGHRDMSDEFNPHKKVFSYPEHFNRLFSKRRPGQGMIRTNEFGTQSLIKDLVTHTDTKASDYFGVENRAPNHGLVPGVNAPFLGEMDTKMMQAMSQPLNSAQTITSNEGRFSKHLYLNNPKQHQAMNATLASQLGLQIDKATTALHSKLVTLQAAQSGRTEYFCQGIDLDEAAHFVAMANVCREEAKQLVEQKALQSAKKQSVEAIVKLDRKIASALETAMRYEQSLDNLLRENISLIWKVFTASRPLMTVVNGKARGTGCGVAMLSKFAAMRDSTELIFDGPSKGITPVGGMTHLLARPETALKYPGLAEFVMLTGNSLFAGDALKLGWTDLYCNTQDIDYHIKDWFNATEHMHNDAIAWQLGHLLESCFKMKEAHSGAMERSSITPTRARWIEDVFADQPSVEAVIATLSEVEALPFSDANNTSEVATPIPFTLPSVGAGVEKLKESSLAYNLAPWDITPPEEPVEVKLASEVFTSYVLERQGGMDVVVNSDRHKLRKWREQRYKEYKAFEALLVAPTPRHVFVRLEGCEGVLRDFEFQFDQAACLSQLKDPKDEDAVRTALLDALKQKTRSALQMPDSRPIQLGWYLPTLDTCPIFSDEDLHNVLRHDPGISDPANPTQFPPVYLVVKRETMHFSEWAFAVKHQLLLQSPFALKASFQLLQEVRGDGSEEALASISQSLSKEYKYVRRLATRPDFFAVGQHTEKSESFWGEQSEKAEREINATSNPLIPFRRFSDVFEKDVELGGHKFRVRPRWSPRTLEEVDPAQVAALSTPLDFETDGTTELDVPTFTSKRHFITGMVDDCGVEVIAGLGEVDASGKPKVAPLVDNAHVPTNVDFYKMARHPWNDTETSWRQDGFTKGSSEYFNQKYEEARQALYDSQNQGQHKYWPSKSEIEGTTEEKEKALLQDRFYNIFQNAEKQVDGWARELRDQAKSGTLSRKMEIATSEEKVFDDEYYRWFIVPGAHPNPSGLLYGKRSGSKSEGKDNGAQVEATLQSFGALGDEPIVGTEGMDTEDPTVVGSLDDVEIAAEE